MATIAQIREQIETSLAHRIPAALTLKIKQLPNLFSTGIKEVDVILDGGIPRGSITEVSGEFSTGKTSLALSAIAAITQLGAVCAWVDVSDAFSPESAAAAHIVMQRLLWIRALGQENKPWSRLEQALKAADLLLQAGGFAAIVFDLSDVSHQHARRIALTTWYRYRLTTEQARTAFIVLTQSHCTGSCATVSLRCEPSATEPFSKSDETALFEGQTYQLVRERNRNESSTFAFAKPSVRAEWYARTQWSRIR